MEGKAFCERKLSDPSFEKVADALLSEPKRGVVCAEGPRTLARAFLHGLLWQHTRRCIPASARRGSLVVNEWAADLSEERAVVLDRQAEGAALEERLSVAAAAILEARRDGAAIRLVSQGHDETYSASGVHWDQALRFLAGAETPRAGEPHLTLEAVEGARVA